MWRSNFYLTDIEKNPLQTLFEKLCERYKIPEELSLEKKIQVLGIWETMQMNAFLSTPITISADVSWETVMEVETLSLIHI